MNDEPEFEPTERDLREMQGGCPARVCLACEKLRMKSPEYIAWRREYQKQRRAAKRAARENVSER